MRAEGARRRWAVASARDWRDIEGLVPETGIDMVDADHRVLLEYVVSLNLLAEDAAEGLGPGLLARQAVLLDGLREFTARHFSREEALLARLGDPGLPAHRAEHARIVRLLGEGLEDFSRGRLTVSPELRRRVFAWFVEHIAGTDYETFGLSNLAEVFAGAEDWDHVRDLLRSTGIDLLDAEHRALSEAILAAAAALRRCADSGAPGCAEGASEAARSAALRDLGALIEVCGRHFSDEEAFMAALAVPGIEAQAEAHRAFLARLREIRSRSEAGDAPDPALLNRELFTWLADHVNRLDYETFRRSGWVEEAFEGRSAEELGALVRRTGVGRVDAEHLEFVSLAAAFAAAGAGGAGTPALAEAFAGLVGYAGRHFAAEEGLFPEAFARGPGGERHREEHRRLLESLREYGNRLAEGRVGALDAARGLVLGAWVRHTNGPDIETFGSAAMGEARRE